MWTKMLNLWLESLWVPISNISSSSSNFICIPFEIGAVFARTAFIAKAALSEALTIHLEALGPRALARKVLNSCTLLLEQRQLGIQCHCGLPLNGLLARAPRPALLG